MQNIAPLAAAALTLITPLPATAADTPYPTKPIRLIVPFPPGGGTDIVARLLSTRLSDRLGQQVVVDNRGGANAIIGTDLAAKSPADGYTLLLCLQANMAVNPGLYRKLPYDPARDFAPVIQLNAIALLLSAHPGVQASNVKDLIQLARNKPGQITFGSSGTGSSSHLAMELLKSMTKVDMAHVPYKGGGPAVNDLVGGQINVYSGTLISLVQFVKAGRIRALAVTNAKRLSAFPDIPTIAETVAGYESSAWQGIVVPKATPAAIVTKLNQAFARVLQIPEIRDRLANEGADAVGGTPEEFGRFMQAETAKYAKLIREAGVKAE